MNYLIRKVKYLVIKMYNEQKYCNPRTLMASQVDFKFKANLGFVRSSSKTCLSFMARRYLTNQ